MYKKMFLYLAMLTSFNNISCFNLNNPKTKAMLTTIKYATGTTFACALLAIIPDKESSAKEKMCLVACSTLFAGILSGLIAKLDSRSTTKEALMLKRARNTGILCGFALPIKACLTYYDGKNPRNIGDILETSIKFGDIFQANKFN